MALLSLALLSLFTLTSYVPLKNMSKPYCSSLALLSLFTLTSYVHHGPTAPWPYCPWPYSPYSP